MKEVMPTVNIRWLVFFYAKLEIRWRILYIEGHI